jgi:hypothetical protein
MDFGTVRPGIKLVAPIRSKNAALKAIFFNYNFLSHHGDVGSGTSNPIIPSFKKQFGNFF